MSNKRKFDSKKNGSGSGKDKSHKRHKEGYSYPNNNNKNASGEPLSQSALKQVRQSSRRHAEPVIAAKEIWNKLRCHKYDTTTDTTTNTTDEEKDANSNSKTRADLVQELMNLLKGKFYEVAMQHDASRVVQSLIQYATTEQRQTIVKEICNYQDDKKTNALMELAKLQYAHFVLLKMIKYCHVDSECVNMIVKGLKGNMGKLAVHAVGSRVVELLFATFPPKTTSRLKMEFYGHKFSLFADLNMVKQKTSSHPTLDSILDKTSDTYEADKAASLQHLLNILTKGIDKSLYSFAFFQQLLCEYVTVASPNEVRKHICPLLVDHAIHLISTKAGTRVVAECVAYGTPKDRKRVMKSLKGYTRSSLLHPDAYIAIVRIIDTVDDTVNVCKSVLAELHQVDKKASADGAEVDDSTSPILDIALSNTGSKLLLYLLAKDVETRRKYFDPAELEILHANPTILDESTGEEVPTSKKNMTTRRNELLQQMKKLLIELCCSHTEILIKSLCGSKILREVCAQFPSKELAAAVANACESSSQEGDGEGEDEAVCAHQVGHRTIKSLILMENDDKELKAEDMSIAAQIYFKFEKRLLETIGSSNRGAFVLVSLASTQAGSEAKKKLQGEKVAIQKLIKQKKAKKESTAGYELLLKSI